MMLNNVSKSDCDRGNKKAPLLKFKPADASSEVK